MSTAATSALQLAVTVTSRSANWMAFSIRLPRPCRISGLRWTSGCSMALPAPSREDPVAWMTRISGRPCGSPAASTSAEKGSRANGNPSPPSRERARSARMVRQRSLWLSSKTASSAKGLSFGSSRASSFATSEMVVSGLPS